MTLPPKNVWTRGFIYILKTKERNNPARTEKKKKGSLFLFQNKQAKFSVCDHERLRLETNTNCPLLSTLCALTDTTGTTQHLLPLYRVTFLTQRHRSDNKLRSCSNTNTLKAAAAAVLYTAATASCNTHGLDSREINTFATQANMPNRELQLRCTSNTKRDFFITSE